MRRAYLPYIEIVLAAALFSTGGAVIKASTFTNWQVAGFRSGLAAAVLLLALPAARRGWSWRAGLVALTYAATMILFVAANKLTTSMNAVFLQAAAPLYILILGPLLLKEPVHLRDLGLMGVTLAGLLMFFLGSEMPQQTAPRPALGNVLGALSGLTWAFLILGLRWLGRNALQREAAVPAVVMGNLATLAVCLPLAVPLASSGPADWLRIGFLGVFQVALAYVFLIRGLARAAAFTASILLLAEPVLNPIWAYLLHGERPGAWAVAGGCVILTVTVVRSFQARSQPG